VQLKELKNKLALRGLNMDNYKYYTGSLAHDYNMFMPKEKEEQKKADVIKHPNADRKSKQNAKAVARSVSSRISAVAVCTFVIAMVCTNIYFRAEITSVHSQISDAKSGISELESEQIRLNCEIERRISFENLEQAAEALGMQKKERSQIVYIKTNTGNAAENGNGDLLADAE